MPYNRRLLPPSFPRSFIWAQGFATSSSSGGRPTGLSDKTAAAADASDSSFDVEVRRPACAFAVLCAPHVCASAVQAHSLRACWGIVLADVLHALRGIHRGTAHAQAQFCVAGGALPTWNADRLPVPLPDVLLLG